MGGSDKGIYRYIQVTDLDESIGGPYIFLSMVQSFQSIILQRCVNILLGDVSTKNIFSSSVFFSTPS